MESYNICPFISLNILFSRYIKCCSLHQSLLPFQGCIVFHSMCIHHICFYPFTCWWRLGELLHPWLLWIMLLECGHTNISWRPTFNFWSLYRQVELLNWKVILCLILGVTAILFSKGSALQSQHQCRKIPISLYPHQHLLFSGFSSYQFDFLVA